MKICPVCNDSFADDLNFCDVDGTRLAREGSAQERNKWWSLLGAGLLVAAVLISAASIFFLPKARVSQTVVTSETQPATGESAAPSVESNPNVAGATPAAEAEQIPPETVAPELKRKEKELANEGEGEGAPNPKAAALAAEGVPKEASASDVKNSDVLAPIAEPASSVKTVSDARPAEPSPKITPVSSELKKEQSQSAGAKTAEKDQNSKKKSDDKDKKKGGFLRVFKKIFGKD